MSKLPIHLEDRSSEGAKKFSPTAARNKSAILDALAPYLSIGTSVLEIASGTGEHAQFMCEHRPDLMWQPTDPDPESRASQNAWRHGVKQNMAQSLDVDVCKAGWEKPFLSFDAIYCANMIHIAPLEALKGLVSGASTLLKPKQILALYGPFLEGEGTASSNLTFDLNLKARNPSWGVRDLVKVKHMFADEGFNECTRLEMPKNNRLLIFKKNS